MTDEAIVFPSEVSDHVGRFDRFAEWASLAASRARFFAGCVFVVVAWLIEGFVLSAVRGGLAYFLNQTYQLQINTLTTVLTFLMVALLQNSQTRQNNATQHKLNAVSDGLYSLMCWLAERDPEDAEQLQAAAEELRAAVGLEARESA